MAKEDKSKASIPSTQPDLSKYMPEGYSQAELQKVGGLTPIVPAELLHDREAIVAGWIVALLEMPPRESMSRKGEKEPWHALLIELTGPCPAQSGQTVVERVKGDMVVVPVGGSLKNNRDLLRAATDTKNVYFGTLRVVGSIDTGKPTEMWDYEVQVHPKPKERTGIYALQSGPAGAPQLISGS